MNGFKLYVPNARKLSQLHLELANACQNYHLRSIIRNNIDLFLADSIHLLTIMLGSEDYQYDRLTDSDQNSLIHSSMGEFIPVMESTIMQDIEEYASAMSGRGSDHLYTLDMIDSMICDYESWINTKFNRGKTSVVSLLVESIMQEHLDKNLPNLIYCVNKHNKEATFPDLSITTASPKQMLLNVKFC